VLTDCDEEALGLGLLAHCAKLHPVSIEPWELVRTQFGVADLDPALVKEGRWLAEALIEQIVGTQVRERCERGEHARCRFEVLKSA